MKKVVYRWVWKNEDGSDRKIEIATFQSKDVARERALSYFPGDQVAIDWITSHEPEELDEADLVTA